MLVTKMDLNDLIKMNEDTLRELLTEEDCNKQELRELIYRLKRQATTYKEAYEYEKEKNSKLENKAEKAKEYLSDL